LVDFLRNTEPPAGNSPQPLAVGVNGARQLNGITTSAGNRSVSAGNSGYTSIGANGDRPSTGTTLSNSARSRIGAVKSARAESYQTTSELADFLKNSGPPGDGPGGSNKAARMMGSADAGPSPRRMGSKSSRTGSGEGKSIGAKFWRRKGTVDA